MKKAHLLSAVILGLTALGVQAAEPEFKKNCAIGMAMKKHIPTDCSVMWNSEKREDVLLRGPNSQRGVPQGHGSQPQESRGVLVAAGSALIRYGRAPLVGCPIDLRRSAGVEPSMRNLAFITTQWIISRAKPKER
ncbi:MAG: hypothetical protein ACHBNF_10420 [Chromatiales bacterium]